VSYDGTDFAGSQRQAEARTVQQELERAAAALFGQPVRVALAGRTDAGVHAIGQVAAFSAETRLDAATVGRALNAHLAEDVAVCDVRPVVEGFDPRRWARRRRYRYTVYTGDVRSPLCRRFAWHVADALSLEAMDAAAGALPGTRDFIACSGTLEAGRTSVRTVHAAGWRCEGAALQFTIAANAFLPQMVRRLTGALIRVGRGALDPAEFARLIELREPGAIGPVAPAHGLCLMQVEYDEGYVA
jgi:tRNA pseudouridine38-40 synthase